MLTSETDQKDIVPLSSKVDLSDYQADIFDNRITSEEKEADVKAFAEQTEQTESSSINTDVTKHASKLLRPSPSDELPVKMLMLLPTSKNQLPKEHDRRLARKTLGTDYNSEFMSDVRPLADILRPNDSLEIDYKNYKNALTRDELPDDVKHLTFNVPGRKNPARIKSKKQRRKIRQKLWAHISCPVVYKWKDWGPMFYPRWVKEGNCYKEHSCSIPSGMTCQPSEELGQTLLFWHCKYNGHCLWMKFHYPIISKCKCAC
jgi:noggin